ncbi:MAG TPA: hypothetical protein VG106_13670, partial [Vicinamibacterales bacterium]|nr:hypothetical protein [Vicinamibacterales bacterium]
MALPRLRAATLFVVLLAVAAAPAGAQSSPPPSEDRPVFHPPNSIQIGDFRLTVRVRLHQDFRRFSSDAPEGWEPTFRRARVGLQGQVSDNFEYDLDAELRDE